MKLRTEISISSSDCSISHQDKIMMLGSCFAESISTKLIRSGFNIEVNPFGILYNPASIAKSIQLLLCHKSFSEEDLFEHEGLYHSFHHHSRFSGLNKSDVLNNINERMKTASRFIKETSLLIITFGTASVYNLVSSGEVVANCHKLPARMFTHKRLSVEEIVNDWKELIYSLRENNKNLRILFTISPIRHWKDGANENQLNKATLLLAVDRLVSEFSYCEYFPSYEIVLDELRDYRFYAEDMIHPNNIAINYIWEKFRLVYFNEGTRSLIKEWESIQQALLHKPFNPESTEYKIFYTKSQVRKEQFLSEHPEIKDTNK